MLCRRDLVGRVRRLVVRCWSDSPDAETLQRYEKSCTALSTGVAQWAAGAAKSLDVREQQQRVLARRQANAARPRTKQHQSAA